MAIEPLGSIMTVQVQPIQKAVTEQKIEPVSTEANSSQSQVNNIDPATVSVAAVADTAEHNAENTGKQNEDSQNGSTQEGTGNSTYIENVKQQNEKIRKAVEQLNKSMSSHSSAVFGIHEKTNRLTIKIIDKDTKEVIKELPPEKTLDMIAKVWEIAGILVDEKR